MSAKIKGVRVDGEEFYLCHVCDGLESDGLEACAECYNAQIAETAKMREERDAAYKKIKQLEEKINGLEEKIEDNHYLNLEYADE